MVLGLVHELFDTFFSEIKLVALAMLLIIDGRAAMLRVIRTVFDTRQHYLVQLIVVHTQALF